MSSESLPPVEPQADREEPPPPPTVALQPKAPPANSLGLTSPKPAAAAAPQPPVPTEPPPPPVREDDQGQFGGGQRDRGGGVSYGRQGAIQEIDKDVASMGRLAVVIKELRSQDETYVSAFRVEPAFHPVTRKSIKGFKERWPVADFRGPEDLLDRIKNNFGGQKWDLRFSIPDGKDSGSLRYYKSIRIEIDAEPMLDGMPGQPTMVPGGQGNGSNGATTVFAPPPVDVNADVMRGTFDILRSEINKKRDDGGSRMETMGLVKDIVQMTRDPAAAAAAADGFKEALRLAEKRADDARAEVSELRRNIMMQPQASPDAVAAVSNAHKDAATEVVRLRTEHERALAAEKDRFDRERSFDKERHKSDITRFEDQIKDLTRRLDEDARDARKDLATAESKAADDRKRMEERLDDERKSAEKMRGLFEERLRVEVASAKGPYDVQLASLNERLKASEERATGAERRWEEKLHDVERERDRLRTDLSEERSHRPDPMSSAGLSGLAATAKEFAHSFGYSRDQPSSAPRSETADLLIAAKDAGVIDGIKSIGQQIVGAVAAAKATPAAAPPPWVIPLPRDPVTGYPIMPPPMGAQPPGMPSGMQPGTPPGVARHGAPAAPPQAPFAPPPGFAPSQPAYAPPGAPPGAVAFTPPPAASPGAVGAQNMLAAFVPALANEFEGTRPVSELAKEIANTLPPVVLKEYMDAGVTHFMEQIGSIDPSSPLLSAKGEKFLRELFSTLRNLK